METSDVIQQCLDAQESEATLNGVRFNVHHSILHPMLVVLHVTCQGCRLM